MRRKFHKLWAWSWVLTLPIIFIGSHWLTNTGKRFNDFGLQYITSPYVPSLHKMGKMEFELQVRNILFGMHSKFANPFKEKTIFQNVQLFIQPKYFDQLNSNLPHSGFHYVPGVLKNGSNLLKAKVRYRGDYHNHWAHKKKSLRIKLNKNFKYLGLRTFNLIVPQSKDHLNNFLGYKLAEALGIITPETNLVNLTLNGEHQGIYLLAEQISPSTIQRNSLNPGSIFKGELVKGDQFGGISTSVFDHPKVWKNVSKDPYLAVQSKDYLVKLCSLIMGEQTEKSQQKLIHLLNLENWAKFSAFEILSQTFHYDDNHNWLLYFDPENKKFQPIVWDPMSWYHEWINKIGKEAKFDIIPSPIQQALHQNHRFIVERDKVINDFFKSGKAKLFLKNAEKFAKQTKIELNRDPNIVVSNYEALSPKEANFAIDKLLKSMKIVFNQIEKGYLNSQKDFKYSLGRESNKFKLSFQSRKVLEKTVITFKNPLDSISKVTIQYYSNGKLVNKNITPFIQIQGNQLALNLPLSSRMKLVSDGFNSVITRRLEPKPAYYELVIESLRSINPVEKITGHFGEGIELSAKRVNSIRPKSFQNFFLIAS